MTGSVGETKILTSKVPKRVTNLPLALTAAAKAKDVSPVRIAAEIVRRRIGPQKLRYQDYLGFGIFRPDLTEAERAEFVGDREALALSHAFQAKGVRGLIGLVSDKVLTGLVLRGAGLPQPETLAIARATSAPLPFPVLRGAGQIEAFLAAEGRLPIFGKPIDASRSVGAASFISRDGDTLTLGDGTKTSVSAIAAEIARDYPKGYLFQSLLRPHPQMEQLCGPIVGTLRIVTLVGQNGPEPLYAVLKMPGPGAMVDGWASGRNGMALVDLATGTLIRGQMATNPAGTDQDTNPITGTRLPGAALPDWDRAVEIAKDAHALLTDTGMVGVDVILSDKGPVINELNSNPLASLYQRSSGRGLLNPEFKARFREALKVHGAKLPIKGVRL